jgi:energy-coupling factor transporter ATP-binding protein EcfA2
LETKQENPQALVDFIPKVLSPADVSPGMEPFDEGRREFFWGRTRQVDDLLSILQSSRFLGITGPEGSGKTSLVRAGLMPMLRKGFKGLAGSQWQFCRLRPGISPIDNLAAALSDVDTGSPVSKGSLEWQGEIVKLMRKDHTGLLNAWNAGKMDVSRNLLVVIDNFEDIFTVARKSNPGLAWEQEVNLLFSNMARVLSAPNVPVYFCILMESSYLPSLYNFRVLSPFLSGGLYTLPNFRQDDFAQLARSPLLKLRRELTPEAVSMLQSQFNNDLRNLPALQFKLKALGGLQADAKGMIGPAELLSTPSLDRIVPESLDAFYEGLGEGERNTMKELFSHISQPGEGASRKRPQTVRDIVEKRELDRRDLIKLLTRFKQEMPGVLDVVEPFQRNVTHFMEWNLSDHAIVNLNNAYPLRDWARLEGWIEEERRAEAMYLRLSNAALMCVRRSSTTS